MGRDPEFRQDSVKIALAGLANRGLVFPAHAAWFETDPAAADLPAIRREIFDLVRPIANESDVSRRFAAMEIRFVERICG